MTVSDFARVEVDAQVKQPADKHHSAADTFLQTKSMSKQMTVSDFAPAEVDTGQLTLRAIFGAQAAKAKQREEEETKKKLQQFFDLQQQTMMQFSTMQFQPTTIDQGR